MRSLLLVLVSSTLLVLFAGGCPSTPDATTTPEETEENIVHPIFGVFTADPNVPPEEAPTGGIGDTDLSGSEPLSDTPFDRAAIDRDLDGFDDGIDPAPDDPTVPAAAGSPEAILAHPMVARALAEAEARGLILGPNLTVNPDLELAETYAWLADETRFFLTSNTECEGCRVATGEVSFKKLDTGLYQSQTDHPYAASGAYGGDSMVYVRGAGSQVTVYSVGRHGCDGTDLGYSVSIATALLDRTTREMRDHVKLSVVVAVESGAACGIPGGVEPGAWQVTVKNRLAPN